MLKMKNIKIKLCIIWKYLICWVEEEEGEIEEEENKFIIKGKTNKEGKFEEVVRKKEKLKNLLKGSWRKTETLKEGEFELLLLFEGDREFVSLELGLFEFVFEFEIEFVVVEFAKFEGDEEIEAEEVGKIEEEEEADGKIWEAVFVLEIEEVFVEEGEEEIDFVGEIVEEGEEEIEEVLENEGEMDCVLEALFEDFNEGEEEGEFEKLEEGLVEGLV